nr:MAG TPA: hypothetical protein [Caudoviricetes sp.]
MHRNQVGYIKRMCNTKNIGLCKRLNLNSVLALNSQMSNTKE